MTSSPGIESLERLSAGHPLAVKAFRDLRQLRAEVEAIAETSNLPDADGVNMPTLIWAEGWERKFREAK